MLQADVGASIEVSADDVMQAHRKRVKDAADLGFAVSQEKVPVDTGMLQASGFGPEFRGDDVVFGYSTDYAEDMENGVEPYTPGKQETQELMRWAERIGKDPGFGAYVANTVIPEKGVQAQPYLAPAAERMKPWLDNHGLDL